jgi:multiple sugar transport system substrate-binding protein
MKKKLITVLLAVAMLTSLLSGCAQKKTETTENNVTTAPTAVPAEATPVAEAEPEAEAITLKWAIWDKDITPYWVALKDAYEAANTNVTIELVDLGSTDYMTVLATELSGSGSDFDVVTIKDVPGYATLVSKNTLESLESYIAEAGIDLSQYGGVDSQVRVDGSLYELPFRNDFWVMYYNKDIFDAAGVAYPTNDMTFEEYDALARKVSNPTFGSQIYGTHYHTWRSAVQLFGVLDGKNSVLSGNYDYFKPYYELVLKQEDDQICRNYADLSAEGLHYSAAFSGGDVAMMNMGSWFISTLIKNIGSGEYDASLCGNWGLVKYPHAQGVPAGSTLGTITGLAVTSVSKQKQAAFDFVNWVSSEQGAKIMAETGNFPALMNAEVSGIIAGLEGFPKDAESKEALNVSNLYLEVPYAENVSEINVILDTYHKSIMNREITIDEGITKMNDEVGKLLGN